MTATLLAVCCCTTATILIFALTTTSSPQPVPMVACSIPRTPHSETGRSASGLTKTQAEDLLDWLEAHGQKGNLTFVSGQGFTVRS